MKTERHECGCIAERDRERWLTLCPPHQAEFDERHRRHAAEIRWQAHKTEVEIWTA